MCTVYKNVQPTLSNFEEEEEEEEDDDDDDNDDGDDLCHTEICCQSLLSLFIFQVLVLGAFLKCL